MKSENITVEHNVQASRFEAHVEGQLCVADYRLVQDTMVMTHTGVPFALRHRGIAAALVQAALDHARSHGLRVDPQCSYVEAFMRRHPTTRDLLARS